ncbi:hypothetical protein ACI5KX_13940 [Erythrobacter sp. GH1-10]|uniref:hypothetical protein n=1 Tax=Erythrobacter sp. GH1-10 TaxID=3349334 RepID=UPI003878238D
MAESMQDRLRRRVEEEFDQLRRDIALRNREAVVLYVRKRLEDFRKIGGADDIKYAVFDLLLRLDRLSADSLVRDLSDEQTHFITRKWLLDNRDSGSDAVAAAMDRLIGGERFPKTKRGPKERTDPFYRLLAIETAEILHEAGLPLYANEGNTRFTAAEVIAEAIGTDGDRPISKSLVRDWISSDINS